MAGRESGRPHLTLIAVLLAGTVVPVGAQEVDRYPLRVLERLPILTPAPEPLVVIGTDEHDEDDMIGRLRLARLLPDGGVVLIDRTDPRGARIHDAEGRLVRRIGREGDGPGELQFTLGLGMEVDDDGSIDFWSRAARVIRYGPDGELASHLTLREPLQGTRFLGRLASGEPVLEQSLGSIAGLTSSPQAPRLSLDTLSILVVDPETAETRVAFEARAHDWASYTVVARQGDMTRPISGTRSAPFEREWVWPDGRYLVRFDGARAHLEWFDPEGGEVHHRVEIELPERLVTDRERPELLPGLMGVPPGAPPDRPDYSAGLGPLAESILAEMTHLPVVRGVHRYSDGRIRLSGVSLPDPRPGHDLILSDRGRPIAWYWMDRTSETGSVPLGTRTLDMRGDRVLLRMSDPATGVETVQIRELLLLPPEG